MRVTPSPWRIERSRRGRGERGWRVFDRATIPVEEEGGERITYMSTDSFSGIKVVFSCRIRDLPIAGSAFIMLSFPYRVPLYANPSRYVMCDSLKELRDMSLSQQNWPLRTIIVYISILLLLRLQLPHHLLPSCHSLVQKWGRWIFLPLLYTLSLHESNSSSWGYTPEAR